ncbi:MAG: BrnT family toxin [Candidatus Omnitrophica bacterium]|nr:BrnT family toxin [Candidatus Omnitrophota bacterium]
MDKVFDCFEWDERKELDNIQKHGVDFFMACKVFKDVKRKIYVDSKHTHDEERLFCIGKADGRIITVRFTYRNKKIRIIGAGYWRKGRQYYDQKD